MKPHRNQWQTTGDRMGVEGLGAAVSLEQRKSVNPGDKAPRLGLVVRILREFGLERALFQARLGIKEWRQAQGRDQSRPACIEQGTTG